MSIPIRPLTDRQERVARLVARGLNYPAIGRILAISPLTARQHVYAIARLLPNPHDLPAWRLVHQWGRSVFAESA